MSTPADFTRLSPAELQVELDAIGREAAAAFGDLDVRQLNWRADDTSWSVAQCLDHLLSTNREMFQALDRALDGQHPRTIWQRLPLVPALFGRMMIQSQAPAATRKYQAPATARPSASALDAAIVTRFVNGQRDACARLRALDGRDVSRIVMTSPFVRFITYTVLDGWRLIVAHEHRHLAQARRVRAAPGFPN